MDLNAVSARDLSTAMNNHINNNADVAVSENVAAHPLREIALSPVDARCAAKAKEMQSCSLRNPSASNVYFSDVQVLSMGGLWIRSILTPPVLTKLDNHK